MPAGYRNRIGVASSASAISLAVMLACMAGCVEESEDGFPEFEAAELKLGRAVWLENCQACHGTGLAGAPRIGDRVAWQPRIEQGLPVLYEHAMNGYAGPTGTEMPARGGRPNLDDVAVELAVRYMVTASK
ncbi:MAG: c-type cytochrome [Gammaproteobacteria bacterium]|nr:c-type cytochrome [Gammaproteobacteria bacterium]MBU2478400.1 c-type cytochrome [Gammaproteobacteria bacterium]